MEDPPRKKSLWMIPFTIHATRGLVRDERSRRKTMSVSLVLTVVMLLAGFTVLRPWLEPHEHPWRFVLYWFVCGWGTLLILLLAVFDLLLVRAQARSAQKAIRQKVVKETTSHPVAEPEK